MSGEGRNETNGFRYVFVMVLRLNWAVHKTFETVHYSFVENVETENNETKIL